MTAHVWLCAAAEYDRTVRIDDRNLIGFLPAQHLLSDSRAIVR